MTDRELFDLMSQAAWRATQACREQGYGLGDKVTKDSARAAAESVYQQYRGEAPAPAQVRSAIPPDEPAVQPVEPPLPDPRAARMERDYGEVPEDEPF